MVLQKLKIKFERDTYDYFKKISQRYNCYLQETSFGTLLELKDNRFNNYEI